MPLTDSMLTVAKYVENLLEVNKGSLNLEDVFYGDQERIPRTPAACVEIGDKRRELSGAPRRTTVTVTTYIIVYHYLITTAEEIRELNDGVAEAIETLIHENPKMGGLVIDSLVIGIESGYQPKKNSLFRASRLALETRSQVLLPSSV